MSNIVFQNGNEPSRSIKGSEFLNRRISVWSLLYKLCGPYVSPKYLLNHETWYELHSTRAGFLNRSGTADPLPKIISCILIT
jgi:hypothetical protein